MSSTEIQLFVHDCPDDQAEALVTVLDQYGLHVDWDGPYVSARDGELHIGTPYTDRDVSGDCSERLAAELIAAAPGCMFTVWTDPSPEWLGSLVRYTPTLGDRRDECDVEGTAQFTERQITIALRDGVDGVRELIGTQWTEALLGSTDELTIRYTPSED
jgi:hypothetical protein